ncbi:MAG: septum formation initiator family protein [Bacillota bacterium]|nr:septum formation initiator family protein [Bacillota bacterium]
MDYQPQKQKRPGRMSLLVNRLARKRMSVFVLVVCCAVILIMGWVVAGSIDQDIEFLYDQLDQANDLLFDQEREILRLTEQVRLASTDQFIASEARNKYGYLFPGEIRFVVTNPEVLGLLPEGDAPDDAE